MDLENIDLDRISEFLFDQSFGEWTVDNRGFQGTNEVDWWLGNYGELRPVEIGIFASLANVPYVPGCPKPLFKLLNGFQKKKRDFHQIPYFQQSNHLFCDPQVSGRHNMVSEHYVA